MEYRLSQHSIHNPGEPEAVFAVVDFFLMGESTSMEDPKENRIETYKN